MSYISPYEEAKEYLEQAYAEIDEAEAIRSTEILDLLRVDTREILEELETRHAREIAESENVQGNVQGNVEDNGENTAE
jgi:hypothetical protein